MKKTLLLFLLTPALSFAQLGINTFSDFTGSNQDNYVVLSHPTGLDESAAGTNVVWSFNQLTEQTTSRTRVVAATAQEKEEYPDTHIVIVTRTITNDGEAVSRLYVGGTIIMQTLITGISTSLVSLKYTDNIMLGEFPVGYGLLGNSALSGVFETNGVSGTFTGTAAARVDAYGSFSINGGAAVGAERLKVTQELQLSYMGAPIGTLTQTLYYYYNFFSPAAGPVFRSTSTHITMPLYNVDETQNLYESYTNSTLGNQDIAALPNAVTLVPNPVKDVLHLENGTDVTAVTVFDAAGRMVLQSALANDIDISPLSAGVYVVNVKSGNKIASLKMIKQ